MRSLHVELLKRLIIFSILWHIGPKILHDDRQFADFNEVGHLEFMKRGQQKINLCARNNFTMAVLCVHTTNWFSIEL